MKQGLLKKLLPHIVAVLTFLVIAVIYCRPALEGKVLAQSDVRGWRGMAQQSVEFKEKYGHMPLWTNSMFSGMPTYQFSMDPQIPVKIDNVVFSITTLGLPQPINFFFLAAVCFYLFCVVAGVNPWVSIGAGLAYAFSTYDPIIIAVGHNTKMISIAHAPAVLAGILLLFNRKYWTGFAITALFSMQLIIQNHLQTVYYILLIILFMSIAFLVKSFREKKIGQAIKSLSLAAVAGIIGAAACAVIMLPTNELSKETMRGGKSEITLNKKDGDKTKGGLDKGYAFNWSYGKMETFTMLVPALYGGGNTGSREFGPSAKFVEKLTEVGVPEEDAVRNANGSSYWGDQPGTSGPVYLGAIICLLFVFGLIYLNTWHKWWIIGVTAFAIILAWGKNFEAVNYFLFDHMPFYKNFRAPTTSLIIPQLTFPFLAALAVHQLVFVETNWDFAWKKLKITGIVMAALLVIMGLFYSSASFKGINDQRIKDSFTQAFSQGQQLNPQQAAEIEARVNPMMTALRDDRKAHMGGDLLRSFLLIALAFGALYAFVKRKSTSKLVLLLSLFIFVAFDLLGVATRYLNDDNYSDKQEEENIFVPTAADQLILRDPDHANFRVFNQTVQSPFEESGTSYFHNSIGGYLPARLAYYNDLMDYQLYKGNMQVYNMLNTKYFITPNQQNQPEARQNPDAFGNAWAVKQIKWVKNANDDIQALDSTDLKTYAIIDERYKANVQENFAYDSSATIKVKENKNDVLVYDYSAATPQFVVFSEIFYDKGWNAYVDGKLTPYVRANYALRAMNLPAGKHTVEFKFEPTSYKTGRTASYAGHLLILLSIILAVFMSVRKKEVV